MRSFALSVFFAWCSHALSPALLAEPAEFQPNPKAGGGGNSFKDSPRFRIYNCTESGASQAIKLLEAAYECMVGTMEWRSSGLSYKLPIEQETGPYYKMNVYCAPNPAAIGGAAGVMGSDFGTGHAFIQVLASSIGNPQVTVHEYGHALTYYEKSWVDQGRTGTFWEPMANFVADHFITSPYCAPARQKAGIPTGCSQIELNKVIGSSHQVLVDGTKGTGNYYQSWPIFAYITYNPDNYPGMGKTGVRDMFRKYKQRSNETPWHVLERVVAPTPIQTVIGRYWARMAYVDIGHKAANQVFTSTRKNAKWNTTPQVQSSGDGVYKPKTGKEPRYTGANIIRLKGTGNIGVKITSSGQYTATLAIKGANAVRYVDLPDGSGQASVADGEEATLVIANTPKQLILYDAFKIGGEVAKGLEYEVKLTGATA